MAFQWTRKQKIQRGIWAAAFAACVFVGTLTGAQLKTDTEKKEVSQLPPALLGFLFLFQNGRTNTAPRTCQVISQFRATPPAEQIAALEDQKKVLLGQRDLLQRKLDAFHETVRGREEKMARRAERASKEQ